MNEIVIAIFASTGFWAFVTAIINAITARRKSKDEDLSCVKAALLSVLYDKLYERCMRILRVGEVTAEDRENIHQMLKPYEALGGDGLIHDLCARVDEMPLYVDHE